MVRYVLVYEEYFRDSISVIVSMNLEILVDNDDIQFYVHNQSFIDDGKCRETNWRAAGDKCKRYLHLDETEDWR